MKLVKKHKVKLYAREIYETLRWIGEPVLVWWSIPDGEFLVLLAKGHAGRLLTARMDDANLACYVGIFEPSASHIDVKEALEAHAAGHLA